MLAPASARIDYYLQVSQLLDNIVTRDEPSLQTKRIKFFLKKNGPKAKLPSDQALCRSNIKLDNSSRGSNKTKASVSLTKL
jgi:hypothetical protein